uniref:Uncharacterized protein n=1 Tax=Alexandrium monilatum TaxID=311494 RepID=A0A7S4SWL3_9DINO
MRPSTSVWERFFCTAQCPHCTIADLDAQLEMSESNCDDETMPGVETENLPPMNYFAIEGNLGKIASAQTLPWASLNGEVAQEPMPPPRGREAEFGLGGKGVSTFSEPRKPVASVNPLSRFGFLTATFSADTYLPDTRDCVDVELARTLLRLDRSAASSLTLRRLAPGRYEIDGTLVSVRWSLASPPALFAREDRVVDLAAGRAGSETVGPDDVPLLEYLQQTASIAERISQRDSRTLTFPDAFAHDRFQSMEIACKQARLREREAEASRHRSFVMPLQPPVFSPLMPRAATLPLRL